MDSLETWLRGRLTSALNFAIYDKLREHKIEVPYPQLDVRIRGGSADLKSPV